jgi:hypothetical protein
MLRYALSTKLYKIKILLFQDAYQYIIYTPKVPPNLYLLIVGYCICLKTGEHVCSVRMLNIEGWNFHFS